MFDANRDARVKTGQRDIRGINKQDVHDRETEVCISRELMLRQ